MPFFLNDGKGIFFVPRDTITIPIDELTGKSKGVLCLDGFKYAG